MSTERRVHRLLHHLQPPLPTSASCDPEDVLVADEASATATTNKVIPPSCELESLRLPSEAAGERSKESASPGALTIDEWSNYAKEQREIGVSEWLLVEQERVDAFAIVTGDPQWIHDRDAGDKGSPFGGPIAHGFLVLSLLSRLAQQTLPRVGDVRMALNYGLNKVRWVSPVRVGKRVRARVRLLAFDEISPQRIYQNTLQVTIEVEESEKPACVAEWLTRFYV